MTSIDLECREDFDDTFDQPGVSEHALTSKRAKAPEHSLTSEHGQIPRRAQASTLASFGPGAHVGLTHTAPFQLRFNLIHHMAKGHFDEACMLSLLIRKWHSVFGYPVAWEIFVSLWRLAVYTARMNARTGSAKGEAERSEALYLFCVAFMYLKRASVTEYPVTADTGPLLLLGAVSLSMKYLLDDTWSTQSQVEFIQNDLSGCSAPRINWGKLPYWESRLLARMNWDCSASLGTVLERVFGWCDSYICLEMRFSQCLIPATF